MFRRLTGGFFFLLLILGGCGSSGKDFVRPEAASLVVGQTTIADVTSRLGPPTSRTVRHSLNPSPIQQAPDDHSSFHSASVTGNVETLSYRYSFTAIPGLLVGPINTHTKQLTFWNDQLVYYDFESGFDSDSTSYDERRALSFVVGRTSRSDVIQVLGRPKGEGIYPRVSTAGTRMLIYGSFSQSTKGWVPASTEFLTQRKTARFLFDASDKLVDQDQQSLFTGN